MMGRTRLRPTSSLSSSVPASTFRDSSSHIDGRKRASVLYALLLSPQEVTLSRRSAVSASIDAGMSLIGVMQTCNSSSDQLRALPACSDQLRALPAWVGELANLRSLAVDANFNEDYIHNTFIREIPASIGELGSLRELRVKGLTNVEGLPEGMKRLTGLEVLSVETCGMREVPESIGEMGELRELTLEMPEVKKLPEEMARLTRLQRLSVRYMERLRALPTLIGRLAGLQTLVLVDLLTMKEVPASSGWAHGSGATYDRCVYSGGRVAGLDRIADRTA